MEKDRTVLRGLIPFYSRKKEPGRGSSTNYERVVRESSKVGPTSGVRGLAQEEIVSERVGRKRILMPRKKNAENVDI